ncbi:MAG: hypothetical protein RLZZ317_754 [Actinomycetota bacterium]
MSSQAVAGVNTGKKDLAQRFLNNPVVRPEDVPPSIEGWNVMCAFNPGAFTFKGRVGLVLRVAERPTPKSDEIDSIHFDPSGRIKVESFKLTDPLLTTGDTRGFTYDGVDHLTTISHFRLAWSDDGEHFEVEKEPLFLGETDYETLGIEDARVTFLEGRYYLTYTAVSRNGYGVGMRSTEDWKTFKHHGVIIPPFNKDATLFSEKINGKYYMFHRPTGSGLGGPYIWIASSTDLINWGEHKCIAKARPGMWDSARVGAGAAPIKTKEGWLEIYHGAEVLGEHSHRYCLGALLLDLDDPTKVIARSQEPIMEPLAEYERTGFFGNVVFTNGHVVKGDEILLYYGAADSYSCGARLSVASILSSLKEV